MCCAQCRIYTVGENGSDGLSEEAETHVAVELEAAPRMHVTYTAGAVTAGGFTQTEKAAEESDALFGSHETTAY